MKVEKKIKSYVKMQVEVSEKTNKTLKLEKVKRDYTTTKEMASKILTDACIMIDETGEQIDKTWEKIMNKRTKGEMEKLY